MASSSFRLKIIKKRKYEEKISRNLNG